MCIYIYIYIYECINLQILPLHIIYFKYILPIHNIYGCLHMSVCPCVFTCACRYASMSVCGYGCIYTQNACVP